MTNGLAAFAGKRAVSIVRLLAFPGLHRLPDAVKTGSADKQVLTITLFPLTRAGTVFHLTGCACQVVGPRLGVAADFIRPGDFSDTHIRSYPVVFPDRDVDIFFLDAVFGFVNLTGATNDFSGTTGTAGGH